MLYGEMGEIGENPGFSTVFGLKYAEGDMLGRSYEKNSKTYFMQCVSTHAYEYACGRAGVA